MKNKLLLWFLYGFLTILMSVVSMAQATAQCSMCRAVVGSDLSGKGTGINDGIVYLMVFPYLLVALLAFGMWYKIRKDTLLK